MTPLLPLDSFRQLSGYSPWHFWGIADTSKLKPTSQCNTVLREMPWQNTDAIGRQEIREAIERAESKLLEQLTFRPAPAYVTKTVAWPTLANRAFLRAGAWETGGRRLSISLGEGELRAVGVETRTAISTAAAITYADTDGDGYLEDWSVTVATTVTDVNEIAVYFSSGDRYGDTTLSERWRIAPVTVTLSGGNVTIRGKTWLMVKPLKLSPDYVDPQNIDPALPATSGNFVTTVDIYRRWTNTDGTTAATSQAVIIWETRPSHGWWCCCGGCSGDSSAFGGSPYDPAAIAQAVARVGIRDARTGLVTPAESAYDSTTAVWSSLSWAVCDQPDRVTVRYLAGVALEDGQMAAEWRQTVAILAAADLERPVCACERSNKWFHTWQFDVTRTSGANDEAYAVSPHDLDNPFGRRRGHIEAWRRVQSSRILRGLAQ